VIIWIYSGGLGRKVYGKLWGASYKKLDTSGLVTTSLNFNIPFLSTWIEEWRREENNF
jgi:hypothetical protein